MTKGDVIGHHRTAADCSGVRQSREAAGAAAATASVGQMREGRRYLGLWKAQTAAIAAAVAAGEVDRAADVPLPYHHPIAAAAAVAAAAAAAWKLDLRQG